MSSKCREIGPSKTNEKNILFITKKIKWNNKRKLGYKTQIKTNTSSLSSFLIHFPPLSLSLSFNRILSLVLFLLFFLLYFYPVSIFSFIFSLLSLLFYLSSLTLFPSLYSLSLYSLSLYSLSLSTFWQMSLAPKKRKSSKCFEMLNCWGMISSFQGSWDILLQQKLLNLQLEVYFRSWAKTRTKFLSNF